MIRRFNTVVPALPDRHYGIPPRARLDDMDRVLGRGPGHAVLRAARAPADLRPVRRPCAQVLLGRRNRPKLLVALIDEIDAFSETETRALAGPGPEEASQAFMSEVNRDGVAPIRRASRGW